MYYKTGLLPAGSIDVSLMGLRICFPYSFAEMFMHSEQTAGYVQPCIMDVQAKVTWLPFSKTLKEASLSETGESVDKLEFVLFYTPLAKGKHLMTVPFVEHTIRPAYISSVDCYVQTYSLGESLENIRAMCEIPTESVSARVMERQLRALPAVTNRFYKTMMCSMVSSLTAGRGGWLETLPTGLILPGRQL